MLNGSDDNGLNATGLSDTRVNMHEYEIDWQPDSITWSIDGQSVRTLKRSDTWNATANRYFYPQAPSRVQLSLWPAGLSTNGEGTIEWAGGLIDWNSQYMTNGYYYAAFDEVDIECYDPPSGANIQGSKSYIYTDKDMANSSVEITNENTVLKSFLGTGTNMSANYASASSSASGSAKTNDVAVIPGLTGAGPGTNGQRGGSDSSSSSSSSADSGSGSSQTATATGSASTGFVQGDGGVSSTGTSNAGSVQNEQVLQGSLFAVVVAIVGLCVL